jgi:hypothetical protein
LHQNIVLANTLSLFNKTKFLEKSTKN